MSFNWKTKKVESMVDQVTDKVIVDPNEKYSLLGLSLEGRGLFHRETKEGINLSSKYLNKVKKGDFIYSRLFAWKGAFDQVPEHLENFYVSNEYPTFRVDENQINASFLKYYFNQEKVWHEVEQFCQGVTKGSRNRFKETFFLSMSMSVPDILEQEKIVSRIDLYKSKSENIKQKCKEQIKVINNLLYSIYINLIENSPMEKMAVVAPITRRRVEIEVDREYKELAARSFGKGTFVKPTFKGIDLTWQKPYWVKGGDILFSNIKAWEGAIALVSPEEDDWVVSHRYITCLPNEDMIAPNFLLYYLLSPEGMEQVNLASPGSADRNRTLSLRKLENIEVPIPAIDKQREFEKLLEKIRQMKIHIGASEKELDELFPALLDKAFKGELV